MWHHIKCIDLPVNEYNKLSTSTDSWFCKLCTLPNFTDSVFENTEKSNAPLLDYFPLSEESISDVNKRGRMFSELRESKMKHPKNFVISYININSLSYKFDEIKELLTENIVDVLFIAETKLDSTFNDNLFVVDGYKLQRRDRTKNGGGILSFIKSDIPSSRKPNLESEHLENICLEVHVNTKKWLIMGIYKPPSVTDTDFTNYFTKYFDSCIVKYENYIVLGDLNFDMLNQSKCQSLHDMCDIFYLSQIVKEPTCFMKNSTPSLVDVILTNKKTMCFNSHNIPTGVSDCHNLISTTIKGNLPVQDKKKNIIQELQKF